MRTIIALTLIAALGLFFVACESEEEQALDETEAALEEMAEEMEAAAGEAAEAMEEVTASMEGEGLSDDELAAIFVGVYPDDPDSDKALTLYEEMGTDAETVMTEFEMLEEDMTRLQSVSEKIYAMDEEKGAAFDDEFDVAQ